MTLIETVKVITIGGILRDADGNMIFAYNGASDKTDIDQVETQALIIGIEICKEKGIDTSIINIEIDSLNTSIMDIDMTYLVRRHEIELNKTRHIFREQNLAAEALSKLDSPHQLQLKMNMKELHPKIQQIIRWDKNGGLNYRKKKPYIQD
ncbi:hypothetical protein CASFOL_033248 [Castilleja foliolosa]|uniref:RNase H type-1 domain-containing protein n=1 Tax=Castilleja foliolosa TaxID=1961234 RepID=A0ABD3BZZ5_9LAMI